MRGQAATSASIEVTYPRTPEQAKDALTDSGSWDSGVGGIRGISLAPGQDAHSGG